MKIKKQLKDNLLAIVVLALLMLMSIAIVLTLN